MEPWFLFALLSIFALAGAELSQKFSLTQKADISAITNNFFVWSLQGIGGLVLAGILGQLSTSLSPGEMVKLMVVAVVYFLGGTLFYNSYKGNSPSLSIVLGSTSIIVSTVLGIIFFDEATSVQKFGGIALILSAIMIANIHKGERFSKYNAYALLGGVCFGTAYTLDKSFSISLSPAMYVSFLSFSVAFVSIVAMGRKIIREARPLKVQNFYPMIGAASFFTLFNFFTFKSYSLGGNVGVVDAMNNSSVFTVILFEMLFLRERTNLTKKLVSATLVGVGVWILSGV